LLAIEQSALRLGPIVTRYPIVALSLLFGATALQQSLAELAEVVTAITRGTANQQVISEEVSASGVGLREHTATVQHAADELHANAAKLAELVGQFNLGSDMLAVRTGGGLTQVAQRPTASRFRSA